VLAYLVMELLEGRTLDDYLLHRGSMPPAHVADLVAQIARGLEHAHEERVVHRDLKPANVFLTRDEDGAPLVKILDFGIARLMRTSRTASAFSTASNVVLGTPGYMSFEQAYGLSEPDASFDLWALATIAYEALTGELPVPGLDIRELLVNLRNRHFVPIHERDPGLPRALAGFFERAFAERVCDRYPNASELAHAFECAISIATDAEQGTRAAPVANVGESARPVVLQALAPTLAPTQLPKLTALHRAALRIAWGRGLVAALAIGAATVLATRLARRAPSADTATRTVTATSFVRAEAPGLASAVPPEPEPRETLSRISTGVGESPLFVVAGGPATAAAPERVAPPKSASTVTPPAASAADRARCTPPYALDADGNKKWKRECF
jgi:serine/threonine-protein kinase